MKLIDHINSMPMDQREDFAKRCGTSLGYLLQIAYGNRRCREALAVVIDRESTGAVAFNELRPDVDWGYVQRKAA